MFSIKYNIIKNNKYKNVRFCNLAYQSINNMLITFQPLQSCRSTQGQRCCDTELCNDNMTAPSSHVATTPILGSSTTIATPTASIATPTVSTSTHSTDRKHIYTFDTEHSGAIVWQVDFQLTVQSVPIITKVVSSNPVPGEVYSMQHYVIKFVSDLRQVGNFPCVLGFLHQ